MDRFGLDKHEADAFFHEQNRAKDGSAAVSGSRSSFQLKSANAPGEAILAGSEESLRDGRRLALTAPASRAGGGFGGAAGGVAVPQPTAPALSRGDAAKQISDQGRYVGGKTFFQNEEKWVDSELQKATNANRVIVHLGSPEYFGLLKKHPKAAQWLALGNQVEFILEGTTYSVK